MDKAEGAGGPVYARVAEIRFFKSVYAARLLPPCTAPFDQTDADVKGPDRGGALSPLGNCSHISSINNLDGVALWDSRRVTELSVSSFPPPGLLWVHYSGAEVPVFTV